MHLAICRGKCYVVSVLAICVEATVRVFGHGSDNPFPEFSAAFSDQSEWVFVHIEGFITTSVFDRIMISAKATVAQDLADNIAKPAGWSCSPLLLKFVKAGPETGGGGEALLKAEASVMKLAVPDAKPSEEKETEKLPGAKTPPGEDDGPHKFGLGVTGRSG